jgi:hypothetical protein
MPSDRHRLAEPQERKVVAILVVLEGSLGMTKAEFISGGRPTASPVLCLGDALEAVDDHIVERDDTIGRLLVFSHVDCPL